jgi:tetratricopeptide (TPR) repeat protein
MKHVLPTALRTAIVFAILACAAALPAAEQADRAFRQAQESLKRNDYDTALARLDEAVRLGPKEAKFRGVRGVAWLRKGDYARGTADIRAAIGLNPGDAGQHYQPSSSARLSAEALEHGRRQVVRMLRDRPAMAEHEKEAAFLRTWAARKFAGEDFGELVDWDPSPPLHSDAEHLAPGDGEHAAILVEAHYAAGPKRGTPRSFEELWAGAVYELHNVCSAREFVRLNDEADEGKVSKEAFVAGILKYELAAAQRTRAFYVQVFLPWAAKQKLKTDPALWFCDWWDTPESVLASFTDKSAYPWRPYARTHDWATVHRHWHHAEFDKARKVLERMRDERGYEDEQSAVSYWLGCCLARLKKPSEAIAAFNEAIRLDPDDVAAYRARGEQYEKLGEKSKAAADAAKAKELEKEAGSRE